MFYQECAVIALNEPLRVSSVVP